MAYDVFISFKNSDANGKPTTESVTARKLYDFLTAKGLRVFFSNVVLEFTGKAQYTKVIDEALDSSSFLIAVGSSHDNLNSQWVRYEWESFLNDIRSGIKVNAEVFVLCVGLKVHELPRALRQQQAFDAADSDAFERLYNFIHNARTGGNGNGSIDGSNDQDDSRIQIPPPPAKKTTRTRKWILLAAAVVLVVALVGVLFGLPQWLGDAGTPTAPPGVDPTIIPSPAETMLPTDATESGSQSVQPGAEDDAGWPKYTNVEVFDVTYPAGDVQIPDDAVRFAPKGIATIQTKDGQTIRAIANTLLFHADHGSIKDGLFHDEGSSPPALFSDMASFSVNRDESNQEYVLDIQKSSSSTQLKAPFSGDNELIFMRSDGDQEGQLLTLDHVEKVTFDWAAHATVQEYMLITRQNGGSVLVPQNVLFTNRLNVSGGFGGYHTQFGIELENGSSVEFRRIQQMSIQRSFLRQYDSDSALVDGNGVEIKLKSGEIIVEDIVVSYYGSGYLEYPSALGATGLSAGDWMTVQYVGAISDDPSSSAPIETATPSIAAEPKNLITPSDTIAGSLTGPSGNLINGNYLCIVDEKLYYINQWVHQANLDGTDAKRLTSYTLSLGYATLQYEEGYLYYSVGDGGTVFATTPDGKTRIETLNTDGKLRSNYFQVKDGFIYWVFSDPTEVPKNQFRSTHIETGEERVLYEYDNEEKSVTVRFYVSDDKAYFYNGVTQAIHAMKLDGSENEEIVESCTGGLFCVDEGMLYYVDGMSVNAYNMQTKETGAPVKLPTYLWQGDFTYYDGSFLYSTSSGIFRITADGKRFTTLYENTGDGLSALHFNIYGDRIYFRQVPSSPLQVMDIDGGNLTSMEFAQD